MSELQLDMFAAAEQSLPSSELEGKRISLVGSFQMPKSQINDRLKIAKVCANEKSGDPYTTLVMETDLIVFGKNCSEDERNRILLNEHYGFHPIKIREDQFYPLLQGDSDIQIPKVEKRLNLTIDYYTWQAPTINGNDFNSLVSSPLKYDMENNRNVISGKEIFIPVFENVNMDCLYQIVGNLGGYANKTYNSETNVVMLGDQTLDKLKRGEKDELIKSIENNYNNSSSKKFNIQFTSESDFLSWVRYRLKKCPDSSTQTLLDNLYT